MKNKRTALVIGIGFVLLIIILIIFLILFGLPKNMGPIEPFLNFWDLFKVTGEGMPGKPAYYQIGLDCDTGNLVKPGELIEPDLGCDNWVRNRFERPFNAITQDEYYPDLDIQNAFLGRDAEWYYLRIALFDPQPGTDYLPGTYAMEMDQDVDGRGDLLVLVSEPGKVSGKNWSTQGVQIWIDSNNDVGGNKPDIPDRLLTADGYDTLLFDQGIGIDPNSAWARVFLTGSAYLELAFKSDYLIEDTAFKWWVWSGYEGYSPDLFEMHDFYSREQTGAAYQGMEFFPIKEVFALDSSCASMWGASPDPTDPDFCFGEVKLKEPDYNTCVALKCIIPFLPCRIPPDKPGDDPCILPFKEWIHFVWKPAHQGESLPPIAELWVEYEVYLLDPFCPPGGLPTPTDTQPPPTPTDTPTPRVPPTPTDTPTPRVPICNYDCGCQPDLGENEVNCPKDCPQHCGNGECDCGEDYRTCQQDCKKPCSRDLGENACKNAGGTWTTSAGGPTGGPVSYCDCP